MLDTASNVQRLDRAIVGAIGIAIVGGVLAVIGAAGDTSRFIRFYLVAYLFVLQLALGSLGFLMVYGVVRANWTTAMQRIFAAGARTIPLLALLFIPIALSMNQLYSWANNVEEQTTYLNPTFFIVRAVIYFVVWIGIALTLTSLGYRNQADPEVRQRTQVVSIVGLILYFITASFAAVDWIMSLNPEWFSSAYGVLEISRQALAAFAFAVIVLGLLSDRSPLSQFLTTRTRVDIGALLLVALLVWGYLTYMQYNIMWSANISMRVLWYEPRTEGAWGGFYVAMLIPHLIGLVALLLPGLKRNLSTTVGIATLLLALRLAELVLEVLPTFYGDTNFQVLDLALPVAFFGLWLALFLWSLNQFSLLPEPQASAAAQVTLHDVTVPQSNH